MSAIDIAVIVVTSLNAGLGVRGAIKGDAFWSPVNFSVAMFGALISVKS